MNLHRQAGQLLVMGFEEAELSARLRTMLSTLQPAGVVLFARNIKTPQQTYDLLQQCRRCLETPPFLCVDMEGGAVDRLRKVIAPAPSVAEIAASHNRKLFRRHGQVIGGECRALGFNVDFAPTVDLALEPSHKVMGTRTASADPEEVLRYARGFLRGLKDCGVLGCLKHFPGLGEADLDTHHELPAVSKPWKRLWQEDLYPYRALHRQSPFVMVSHAAYPAVTKQKIPASLSKKWITDVLRKRLGYRGLVITDDMEMGALLKSAPIEVAAPEALRAGADLLLICRRAELIEAGYEAVMREAGRDRRFARLVGERAARVLAFKRRSKALKQQVPPPRQETVGRLRRQIWDLSEQVRMAALAG